MADSFLKCNGKIDEVFRRTANGVNVSNQASKRERGAGVSDATLKTYKKMIHSYHQYVHKIYGCEDLSRAKPGWAYEYVEKQIAAFKAGETSAFTLHKFDDALNWYRVASSATGVYARENRIGDSRVISQMLADNKVIRRSSDSATAEITPKQALDLIKAIENSQSAEAKQYALVATLQYATAGRVTATAKTLAGQWNPKTKEFNVMNDKGGKDTVKAFNSGGDIDKKAVKLLNQLTHGKKTGAPIFDFKYKRGEKAGQNKPIEKVVQQYQEVLSKAAKDAKLTDLPNGKKVTSHSLRKGAAGELARDYARKSRQELEEIKKRAEEKDPKIARKAKSLLESIRAKFKNKESAKERELTKEELVRFLVSLRLAHYRIDVTRYYLNARMEEIRAEGLLDD